MTDDGGLSRIQQRMRAIPEAVQAEVKKALAKAADDIVATAKSLCPVDQGALRDSIGWAWGDQAPNGARVLAQSVKSGGIAITIYAGDDDAYYARWVEFGTRAGVKGARLESGLTPKRQRPGRGRKVNRTHGGTPAQPFFFPAFHLGKKKAASRVKRAITKAVKSHWGKS